MALGLLWLWSVRTSLHRVLALRQPDVDSRVLAMAAMVARELGMRQSPHVSTCEFIATADRVRLDQARDLPACACL
jgi:hypothetical protein